MITLAFIASCLALGTDPALIDAIIARESAHRVNAVNVNGEDAAVPYHEARARATALARAALARGRTVDVGLMQLNSATLERLGVDLAAAFDPCENIRLGERVYRDALSRARRAKLAGEAARRGALSAYNTGHLRRGIENGYVAGVLGALREGRERAARTSPSRVTWRAPAHEAPAADPRWELKPR